MPVWTDTLEPVTLDPREASDNDDEDDGEDSQSEGEGVHILPPPSKAAKPPSPEVIDVDALPSDDDDDSEEEEEDEQDEDGAAYNQEEGGAYGIEDDVVYQDEAESGDQEDAITELEEECDVEGFREPPSSPISGPPTEDDVFASMLSSNSGAPQESTANGAADSLAKFRAQRRREMQQLTEGFISRYNLLFIAFSIAAQHGTTGTYRPSNATASFWKEPTLLTRSSPSGRMPRMLPAPPL